MIDRLSAEILSLTRHRISRQPGAGISRGACASRPREALHSRSGCPACAIATPRRKVGANLRRTLLRRCLAVFGRMGLYVRRAGRTAIVCLWRGRPGFLRRLLDLLELFLADLLGLVEIRPARLLDLLLEAVARIAHQLVFLARARCHSGEHCADGNANRGQRKRLLPHHVVQATFRTVDLAARAGTERADSFLGRLCCRGRTIAHLPELVARCLARSRRALAHPLGAFGELVSELASALAV